MFDYTATPRSGRVLSFRVPAITTISEPPLFVWAIGEAVRGSHGHVRLLVSRTYDLVQSGNLLLSEYRFPDDAYGARQRRSDFPGRQSL